MFDLKIEEIDKIIDTEMDNITSVTGALCDVSYRKGAIEIAHRIKTQLNNEFQNKLERVSDEMYNQQQKEE